MKLLKSLTLKWMGKLVLVEKQLIKHRQGGMITYSNMTLINPRMGWCVGFTYVRTGRIETFYEDNTEFVCTRTTPAMLVKFWPNERAIRVPVIDGEDIIPGSADGVFPSSQGISIASANIYKKSQSGWSTSYPRDKKGRFCK